MNCIVIGIILHPICDVIYLAEAKNTPQKSFAPLTLYSLYLRSSGAPLHTLFKLYMYDVPVSFLTLLYFQICIALFAVAVVAVARYRMKRRIIKTLRVCIFAQCEEKLNV